MITFDAITGEWVITLGNPDPDAGGGRIVALETHIYRLRQKIEQNAAAPTTLVAEAGGYKLVP